jgi:hypothetical protein
MTFPSDHLEAPPAASQRRREARWAVLCLGALALVLLGAFLAAAHLRGPGAGPMAAVDHGPLPAAVRAQALDMLQAHLAEVQLTESFQGPVREFHVKGRAREGLAQDFHKAFRPLVADRLMPLLRPYGEVISFDVASLDLPPARLRPLSTKE